MQSKNNSKQKQCQAKAYAKQKQCKAKAKAMQSKSNAKQNQCKAIAKEPCIWMPRNLAFGCQGTAISRARPEEPGFSSQIRTHFTNPLQKEVRTPKAKLNWGIKAYIIFQAVAGESYMD